MTTTINLVGARGGVGTTTVAATLAYALATDGSTISVRGPEENATRAVFGAPKDGPLAATISYNADPLDTVIDYKIVDYGTDLLEAVAPLEGLRVLVLRNDYLSLRRVVNQLPTVNATGEAKRLPFDVVILVEEPGRALGRREVADVLGGDPEFLVVPVTERIARAVDAGVLHARPGEIKAPVDRLADFARARQAILARAAESGW